MKICKNCKYFVLNQTQWGLENLCSHPRSQNPITGNFDSYCGNMGDKSGSYLHDSTCDVNGDWYEEKDPLASSNIYTAGIVG